MSLKWNQDSKKKFGRRIASLCYDPLVAMTTAICEDFKTAKGLAVAQWLSRSSIQQLSNRPSIGDSTSRSILHLFQQFSDRHPIHPQWDPSHVDLPGKEVADNLAKATTSDPVDLENHMIFTSTEIYSRAKELICRTWVVRPVHPIIQGFQIISDDILAIFYSSEVHEF
ncbi:RNase H domain-containing protein [Trichonephila clavipes]|nr:RNase H domain-containing protein [Trichonephila clavipes]